MDVIMDKQHDGDGGVGSNSKRMNGTKQVIEGASNSQSIISLFMNYLSLQGWQNSTSDDDDNNGTLPPKK
jgi:hypothetical protein